MTGTIFISFFSPTIEVLLVGLIFCGICRGIFATIGPAYSSEVCPLAFRGYLTAYTNMCFAMGQFIAGGVLEGLVNIPNEWSYRIPFAVQWAFPLPLFCILWFAPESPWWLVRKGKYDDAVKVMRRLTLKKTDEVVEKQMIAMMIHTNELEQEIESGSSWLDCFRGIDLRRTEIACITFSGQVT
jgi:SP family general alpha glucoside:H+ symporter-like MFS transporter